MKLKNKKYTVKQEIARLKETIGKLFVQQRMIMEDLQNLQKGYKDNKEE